MIDDVKVWVVARKGKRKTHYDLRWFDAASGKYRSKCVGTDRKRAERNAARMEDELANGTYREIQRMTWQGFVDEHVRRLDRTPATVNDVERTLKAFGKVCDPTAPRNVTYRMVETFAEHLRGLKLSVATINKHLRYLRGALNAAVDRDYLNKNPMDKWRWTRQEETIPRALTDGEKTKLLDACPTDQWRTLVYVALTTGCRRGELLSLTWDRVDFDQAHVVVTATKAHKDRIQPLNPDAVAMLRRLQASTLKDGGPFRCMKLRTINQVFQRIVGKAGIPYCTIHDLRKTFCTDLARLGVNQLVVQRLAGHASGTTTARYYQHVDDAMKREAIDKLKRRSVG